MKKIAFARIAQETNALSPVDTTLADFEGSHYVAGDALLQAVTDGPEVPGFFRRAELGGFARACRGVAEPVPVFSAWAPSGGPLSKDCFETLEARLVEGLRAAGPVDAFYFCLHGAMGARGIADPEARLLRAARTVIGGAPLVVSHDLHGNVTRARVELADALVAYQTNPHRDHARTGKKAGRLAVGMASGTLKPQVAWRSLPMILGGGKTIDFLQPMRPVFRRMHALEKDILAASVFMVHPWNDDPALGWSTLAVAEDLKEADRAAEELAEMCWQRRLEQPPHFPGASEAIAMARAASFRRRFGCVTMADASDVVTAGAPGDSTHLLKALIEEASGMRVFAAVRDPAAVDALWARAPGDIVTTTLGKPALGVRGKIVSRHERHGFGKNIVLAVENVSIVITEGPSMVMRPSFYTEVGLDPWRADIVVVKNFFPFLMFFLPYSRKNIFVRTQGVTDFDAAFQLPFDGPMHPRDTVDDWRARDRLRRGVA